jgi:hypothetical protein
MAYILIFVVMVLSTRILVALSLSTSIIVLVMRAVTALFEAARYNDRILNRKCRGTAIIDLISPLIFGLPFKIGGFVTAVENSHDKAIMKG